MRTYSKWGRGNERGCEAALIYTMSRNRAFSSHELARKTGYTPQHINRVLKKMFAKGQVAYTIVKHKGSSEKRLWANCDHAGNTSHVYPWEFNETWNK